MGGKRRAGAGQDEISGSKGRRVQVRAARGAKKATPKRVGFTAARKRDFLAHFAATCNAKAAARAAGVSNSTVYEHRRKDPAFRAGWDEALAEGYARLEAELVRRAAIVPRVRASEAAARANQAIDPRTALAILESYRRNGGRRPGEILPQPYDMETVRARIEKKMRALGMVPPDGEGPSQGGPSTASRSPSPADAGED